VNDEWGMWPILIQLLQYVNEIFDGLSIPPALRDSHVATRRRKFLSWIVTTRRGRFCIVGSAVLCTADLEVWTLQMTTVENLKLLRKWNEGVSDRWIHHVQCIYHKTMNWSSRDGKRKEDRGCEEYTGRGAVQHPLNHRTKTIELLWLLPSQFCYRWGTSLPSKH